MILAPILLLLLAPMCACAGSGVGATTLNLPISVAQTAMGDVSLGGNDLLRAWTNPASLSEEKIRGRAVLAGGSLFGGMQSTGCAGVAYRINGHLAAGLIGSYYSIDVDEVDVFGNKSGESLGQETLGVGPILAINLRWLSVGGAVRYISDSVGNYRSSAVAGDLGGIAKWGILQIGVSARNLGDSLDETDGFSVALPQELRTALSIEMNEYKWINGKVAAAIEYTEPKDGEGRFGAGCEIWPGQSRLAIRCGMTGLGEEDDLEFTAGLGFAFKPVIVEYSISTHAIGNTSRAGLSYQFGGNSK